LKHFLPGLYEDAPARGCQQKIFQVKSSGGARGGLFRAPAKNEFGAFLASQNTSGQVLV